LLKAERYLAQRIAEERTGTFIPPTDRHMRIRDLWTLLEADYRQNGKRALPSVRANWNLHLEPVFGNIQIERLGFEAIVRYRDKRLSEGASAATVNRETSALHRMFTLGQRANKLRHIPPFPARLREDNIRQGFVEDTDFDRLLANASAPWLRALLRTTYAVGNRRGELLDLRCWQVELHNNLIRLTTKTKSGRQRVLPITADMKPLLTAATFGKPSDAHVFSDKGVPITPTKLRLAWRKLTAAAKLPGLRFHDLRRSAIRNMESRGVTPTVAKAISGHLTNSVYERYRIVDETSILNAGRKIATKPVDVQNSYNERREYSA
jgi:integrase